MHVAIVAHRLHPLREPFAGGLEALTWQLSMGLRERGIAVTVAAGPDSDPRLDALEVPVRPLQLSNAARHDESMPSTRFMEDHYFYLQVMAYLADSAIDVIHNNSLHYLPIAMASAAGRATLTTLHTPPTAWMESAIAMAATTQVSFSAVSRHTSQAWSHVCDSDVILNGVDTRTWRPGPGGADLVWSGRLVAEKGADTAIAIARRANRTLRLAGPVSDPDYFRNHIAPQLDDRIQYLGHLDRSDLSRVVGNSAVALVTPRWDEPYGLVAAEALACGTPVVAFRRGGLPEVVNCAAGRVVAESDMDGAVTAVAELEAEGPGLRVAARAWAETRLSVDAMIDRYIDRYEGLSA